MNFTQFKLKVKEFGFVLTAYIFLIYAILAIAYYGLGKNVATEVEVHVCPAPTRLAIQKHWIAVPDPNYRIVNHLDSKMLDQCSIECDYDYWDTMELGE